MDVRCPECQGRRRLDYCDWQPALPVTDKPDLQPSAEAAVRVLRDQRCRTCKGAGHIAATERVAVLYDGRRVGTVPPDFDPARIKSESWLYTPRHGDFRREGDAWVADPMLGPGDLESVPGFVWDRR